MEIVSVDKCRHQRQVVFKYCKSYGQIVRKKKERRKKKKNSGTCKQLTVDAPGDCGGWDAFSLTVQSHSFPRSIELVLGLLYPVWSRYKQEAKSYSLLLPLRTC